MNKDVVMSIFCTIIYNKDQNLLKRANSTPYQILKPAPRYTDDLVVFQQIIEFVRLVGSARPAVRPSEQIEFL
jgi:hypothetical protein